FDETDVVCQGIEPQGRKRAEIAVDDVVRRRLQHDLKLVVVLQPEWIVAVSPVRGAPRGLYVSSAPGFRSDSPQQRRGVERAGPHLHVIGLQNDAALLRPIVLQGKNELLKRPRRNAGFG